MGRTTSGHRIASREEWLAARLALLEQEKELTRRSDELARQRAALPWVPVDNDYAFATEAGEATLAEARTSGSTERRSAATRTATGGACTTSMSVVDEAVRASSRRQEGSCDVHLIQ